MSPWIADRMQLIDASGIRKVFDLAAKMKDPINLSIGQPHFDTPQPLKQALSKAVEAGKNAYSQTQGIAPLLAKAQASIDKEYGHADRQVFITSGTSGGLMLALMTLVNPGDEVIAFDPWFVMYKHLTTLAGGKIVRLSTYPDFKLDLNQLRDAITDRTKVILFNSPCNPTGRVAEESEVRALADLCREKNIALISDEIYRSFCYDRPFVSPAKFYDRTIVIDGFSKSHSMTGWRIGWCHGPQEVIQQMIKLQQFTFVCAPTVAQHAALAALDVDMGEHVRAYERKRDALVSGLEDRYRFTVPSGSFYAFLEAPDGTTGSGFAERALEHRLLVVPGGACSERDTHFRVSFAVPDETLARGIDVLKSLAH